MRTREADVRDAVLLGEVHDDRANARPEVDVLMGVEVAELQAEVEPGLHLGAQLAADVVEVDPTGCRAGHEGSVGQRESSGAVHERRHFTGAEQGRVLADEREVDAGSQAGSGAQHGGGVRGIPADGEERGGGDDPVDVCPPDGCVDPSAQAQVVGIDDQRSRHRSPSRSRGRTDLSSCLRSRISPRMVRITPADDRVDTPRVRGK